MKEIEKSITDYWFCKNCKSWSEGRCSARGTMTKEFSGMGCLLFEAKENVMGLKLALGEFTNSMEMGKRFIQIQPLFYDKSKLWWIWNFNIHAYELIDETDLFNRLDDCVDAPATIDKTMRDRIKEVLKRIGRKNTPKPAKKIWVQFKDVVVDIKTGEQDKASSEYFLTNPIPIEIGKNEDTPTLDKIFEEWVGKKYVRTLYEVIAYCCLPDYPIHRFFILYGAGLNGKGKFMELISNFIGKKNQTSTDLDILLNSRFEVTKLHKKLVCFMGETNFNIMKKTAILKRLTGGDLVGFEYKHKTPMDDYNYAKIIIASNSLPMTTDKTIGFYRRPMIIDFPNRFTEKKDILATIPDEEYKNLAKKCVRILKELVKDREFTNEGSIEKREMRYEDRSDPLQKFLRLKTELDGEAYIFKYEFRDTIIPWMKENKYRIWTEREIGINMKKIYEDGRRGNKLYHAWLGLKWKEITKKTENNHLIQHNHDVSVSFPCIKTKSTMVDKLDMVEVDKKLLKDRIIFYIRNNPTSSHADVYRTFSLNDVDGDTIISELKKDGELVELTPDKLNVVE